MSQKPLEWMNRRLPSTVIAILASVLFASFGYQEWSADQFLQTDGVRTEAIVTQNQGRGVFVSIPSRTGRREVQLGAIHGDPKVGDTVPVVYDPQNPSHNKDERALGDPLLPGLAWAASALFLALAVLTWIRVLDWEKLYRIWK